MNVSPNQATVLYRLKHRSLPIGDMQALKQTTIGALYKRGYIEVSGAAFVITLAGLDALNAQHKSHVERANSMTHAPFAGIIRELSRWTPENPVIIKGRKSGHVVGINSARKIA